LTVASLVPLVVEGLPADVAGELVERHVQNREEFWLLHPLPSVAASEPTFNPRNASLTWRGPTWINTNWLLWRGLRKHGFEELAAQLAGRTVTMVAQEGLHEFYNPLNGRGMGARPFGWSALALDMAEG
ncbi:MAG: glycogen debranching protein, partial [Chloroflexi bacterium]|nr:glycogen debranching protein [Chloroflexota bacterium]